MFITELLKENNPLEVEAGAVLFKEGDACNNNMYLVLDGELEVSYGGTVLEISRVGTIIGEMALIDNNPRSATVIAKTPCKLAVIDRTRFMHLVSKTPEFALHVMEVMTIRLRRMNILVVKR